MSSQDRYNNRINAKNRIKAYTEQLIQEYLVELKSVEINEKKYESELAILNQIFSEKFKTPSDFRVANNHLSTYINNGNSIGKWNLKVPAPIVKITHKAPFRNLKWYMRFKELNAWKNIWLKQLDSNSLTEQDDKLNCVLISAAIYGGLCFPQALHSLANILQNKSKPLNSFLNHNLIDLKVKDSKLYNNIVLDEKECCIRTWYPDNFTMCFIINYLNSKDEAQKKPINIKQCWVNIKKYINKISASSLVSINSLKQFCNASIGITEYVPGVALRQSIVEYATSQVPSSSIPPNSRMQLYRQYNKTINKDIELDIKTEPKVKKALIEKPEKNKSIGIEYYISQIQIAIKLKIGGIKNTPNKAISRLYEILVNNPSDQIAIIIEWLIHLMEIRKLTVSSVNTYFGTIGKDWITNTIKLDIFDMNEEDYYEFYNSILDECNLLKLKSKKRARFQQFHQFAYREHNFPFLSSFNTDINETDVSFNRAGYIPKRAYSKLINKLNSLKEVNGIPTDSLVCFLIIAYRTGLRRGELIKLRIKDVEYSNTNWVYIRNNKHGNIKSFSSYRKLPLTTLMTDFEKSIFINYSKGKKNSYDANQDDLLFSYPGSKDVPINTNTVNIIFQTILKEITQEHYVLHDFRHTALTNLHIILEQNYELINLLTHYTNEEVFNIISELGSSNNSKNINWKLAGFAGHLSPLSTFSHYLHLNDYLLGAELRKSELQINKTTLKNVTGLSKSAISRFFNKLKLNDNKILCKYLTGLIDKKSLKYKSNKTPNENYPDEVLLPRKKYEINPENCYSTLKFLEDGYTVFEVGHRLGLEECTIKQWYYNSLYLNQLTTTQNTKRFFSPYVIEKRIGMALAPSKPQGDNHMKNCYRSIKDLRDVAQAKNYLFKYCLKYFMNNTNTSSAELIFDDLRELKAFITLLTEIFPKNKIKLKHVFSENTLYSAKIQKSFWKPACLGIKINDPLGSEQNSKRNKHGNIYLRFSHPKEVDILDNQSLNSNKNQYSTNWLKFIFHMLAIMELKIKIEDLDEVSKEHIVGKIK